VEPVQALSLSRDPAEVARARKYVGRACSTLPEDVRTIAQLLTSEVVTNAVEHGAGDIRLRLSDEKDVIRVEVTDGSRASPRRRPLSHESVRGRGLLILEALSSAWGVVPADGSSGKTVWFTWRTR
jgi:anti-sigma regulatory factor (Ser/Thr protein kinase)